MFFVVPTWVVGIPVIVWGQSLQAGVSAVKKRGINFEVRQILVLYMTPLWVVPPSSYGPATEGNEREEKDQQVHAQHEHCQDPGQETSELR